MRYACAARFEISIEASISLFAYVGWPLDAHVCRINGVYAVGAWVGYGRVPAECRLRCVVANGPCPVFVALQRGSATAFPILVDAKNASLSGETEGVIGVEVGRRSGSRMRLSVGMVHWLMPTTRRLDGTVEGRPVPPQGSTRSDSDEMEDMKSCRGGCTMVERVQYTWGVVAAAACACADGGHWWASLGAWGIRSQTAACRVYLLSFSQ